ncbi:MAG: hypothetical protein ABI346_09005, partial [Candidatus Baltobacteraceae bacterium]
SSLWASDSSGLDREMYFAAEIYEPDAAEPLVGLVGSKKLSVSAAAFHPQQQPNTFTCRSKDASRCELVLTVECSATPHARAHHRHRRE